MSEKRNPGGTVRTFGLMEGPLFPNGLSTVEGGEGCKSYEIAFDYLTYYPGFSVDDDDPALQRSKLAAAASVVLDDHDGVPVRPELGKVISDRNYPEGHILAVPHNRLLRALQRGKSQALSPQTIARYAERYHEGSEGGVPSLVYDLTRLIMSSRHVDDMSKLINLETQLVDMVGGVKLKGVERGLGDVLRRSNRSINNDVIDLNRMDRVLGEVVGLLNRLGEQSLGDRTLDRVRILGGVASDICRSRTEAPFGNMADNKDSTIVLIGTNSDQVKEFVVRPPKKREQIALPKLAQEEINIARVNAALQAQQRHEQNIAEQEARIRDGIARREAIDRLNEPILERVGWIAQEYNQLVGIIYGYSKSILRENCVFGQDSVVKRMLETFPIVSKDTIEGVAKLYAGLAVNAKEVSTHEELMELVNKIAEQKAQYEDACTELMTGGNKYALPVLEHDLISDLMWLDTNFEQMYVDCIYKCNQHVLKVGEQAIDRVVSLLGRSGVGAEEGGVDVDASDLDEPSNPPKELHDAEMPETDFPTLAEVRAIAETVDWTIMPNETCTKDDLEGIICEAMQIMKQQGRTTPEEDLLLGERLQMIVDWREKYGAKLYYSSGKMMDESGNFYFVLTFEQDGKKYAIAENPVYKNATYVIAEHLMPLLEGESLLTVVKELRRKSIRALSGRQVIHREGPVTHPDKVDSVIRQFSVQAL